MIFFGKRLDVSVVVERPWMALHSVGNHSFVISV
jgi:hypothetical protein